MVEHRISEVVTQQLKAYKPREKTASRVEFMPAQLIRDTPGAVEMLDFFGYTAEGLSFGASPKFHLENQRHLQAMLYAKIKPKTVMSGSRDLRSECGFDVANITKLATYAKL